MMAGRRISAVLPAYNEADRLGRTLSFLNHPWLDEIVVVNDGSTDDTAGVAARFPVKLINFPENRGKGSAVAEGIKTSTGDVVILLDADLGASVTEMERLLEPILSGAAEISIAVLPITGGGVGLVRKLAHYGLKLATGQDMEAPLSGQRAITRPAVEKVFPLADGFGLEIGMDIKMIRAGLKFQEIKCDFNHRRTVNDLSGYLHRGRQFISILRTLWLMREYNV